MRVLLVGSVMMVIALAGLVPSPAVARIPTTQSVSVITVTVMFVLWLSLAPTGGAGAGDRAEHGINNLARRNLGGKCQLG